MSAAPTDQSPPADLAALARGGRINFFGFCIRLAARLPFLFIAGRIYGAEALGRFAYAVLIVEFADFQCGACKTQYLNTQPILDKYKGRPSDVRFELRHWPISSLCNPTVPTAVHPASCDAAAAYEMAKGKGTSDLLKDWFFINQEKLSPATVRRAAADVGKITDFDTQFPKAIQQVRTDASLGTAIGVSSTPSFFINGRRIPGGGVAAQYFEALIELELKRAK